MQLTVVIPVYNERETIEDLVRTVQDVPVEKELVIVDDFSTDGTREVLRKIGEAENVRVLLHEVNRGKGAALRTGFQAARGEIVIVQDADLEYDPREHPKVIAPLLDGKADVCYGSRYGFAESHRVHGYWHTKMNQFLTWLSNMFSGVMVSDMETCFKAFRREVIQAIDIEEDRFGFEPEITAKVAALRLRLWEVAISYEGRGFEEGKKIGWRDGVRALWCILKYNTRKKTHRRRYLPRLGST